MQAKLQSLAGRRRGKAALGCELAEDKGMEIPL
jgi:hypothetical protein